MYPGKKEAPAVLEHPGAMADNLRGSADMGNLNPPPTTTANPGLARAMLDDAVARREAAVRTVTYFAAVARDHGIPWADLEAATGLTRPTLQRRIEEYRKESGEAVGGVAA